MSHRPSSSDGGLSWKSVCEVTSRLPSLLPHLLLRVLLISWVTFICSLVVWIWLSPTGLLSWLVVPLSPVSLVSLRPEIPFCALLVIALLASVFTPANCVAPRLRGGSY